MLIKRWYSTKDKTILMELISTDNQNYKIISMKDYGNGTDVLLEVEDYELEEY